MRKQYGRLFWPVSYLGIHLMPTILTWMGSLPLLDIIGKGHGVPLGALDICCFLLGFGSVFVELEADLALAKFRRRPKGTGPVILEEGVWTICRHPNYLGEVAFWWSLSLLSWTSSGRFEWVNFVGSLSITFLFCAISLPLVETRMANKGDAWLAYKKRVPAKIFPFIF